MKILIIEDEIRAAARLQKLITEYFNKNDIQPEFYETLDSVNSAISFFQNTSPLDLLFLDIQLSDGISFDIFNEVHIETPTIFTTAYDEYALKAFQLHSIDYLLKPIEEQALTKSLNKFYSLKATLRDSKTDSLSSRNIQELLTSLASSHRTYKSRFLVQTVSGYISIGVEDIAYFFSEHKISWLVSFDGKKHPVDMTLEEIAASLNPKKFHRANRQYVICSDAVTSMSNSLNGKLTVYLKPNAPDEVIIGREKASQFKEWLDS